MRRPPPEYQPWKVIHDKMRAFTGGGDQRQEYDRFGRLKVQPVPLREYDPTRWQIYVGCNDARCKHGAQFPIPVLLEKWGDNATLQTVMDKTRCTRCGRLPAGLRLIWIQDGEPNLDHLDW